MKFDSKLFFVLFLSFLHTATTTANYRVNYRFTRQNNDYLYACLSSSLPSSVRMIYPCRTPTNQNGHMYTCNPFDIRNLASIRGSRISHSPAVIVYVTTSHDVQNVIKCAAKLDYVVNALSGGHSYEGYSLGSVPNNIIINFEKMNNIHVNVHDKTAIIGPGARNGPSYYTLYQYDNYTIPAGSCAWVGIGGQALGGGYGLLARLHGLLSDHILEMKAVNAQGDALTINATHEPELFWALRGGGGGSFVIVTQFKFRLVKSPPLVTEFTAIWDSNATKVVTKRYQLLMFNTTLSNFSNNLYLQMWISKTQISIHIIHYGIETEEFNRTVSLMLATLPSPNSTVISQRDWLSFVYSISGIADTQRDNRKLLLHNITYPTYEFKAKHLYFNKPINDHSMDLLNRHLALGNGRIGLLFTPWDGYLSTIPIDETAFPHRHYKFSIQFMVDWDDIREEQRQMDWLERVYLSLYNDSTKHSYVNYIDRDVSNWMEVYFSSHKQRLSRIKQMYDKNNRFYFEKSIV
ncbi:hypothetical protein I4U23_013004 [Adineta vaga]|nr:hypothetical protein I4U23_013004 [Adineta vaga]